MIARLLLFTLLLTLTACTSREAVAARPPPTPTSDVTSEHYVSPELPRRHVIVPDAFGGFHRVEVEVAATNASRQRGLMWRRELPEGKGMLFIFPEDDVQSFWMRNTLIPLDMLFIDASGQIVGIIEQAAPKTLTSRSVGIPSQYVLEVPGGWVAEHGIRTGARVKMEGIGSVQVEP